jgi:AbrB family looped-hinge helix DNA binding protein
MKRRFVKIDDAGRITIPENLRKELALEPNQILTISVQEKKIVITDVPFWGKLVANSKGRLKRSTTQRAA